MSYFFAVFKKKGSVYTREMTRIYFNDVVPDINNDECIGVVIAKNPGSAKPKRKLEVLDELELSSDKMLPWISNAFKGAFETSNLKKRMNKYSYVRILNLFTVCNPDLEEAIKYQDINNHQLEDAKSDLEKTPLIFIAWGSEQNLIPFREKWLKELLPYKKKVFYFSYTIKNRKYNYKCEHNHLPLVSDKVKHPQGLPQSIAVEAIKKCIS